MIRTARDNWRPLLAYAGFVLLAAALAWAVARESATERDLAAAERRNAELHEASKRDRAERKAAVAEIAGRLRAVEETVRRGRP